MYMLMPNENTTVECMWHKVAMIDAGRSSKREMSTVIDAES